MRAPGDYQCMVARLPVVPGPLLEESRGAAGIRPLHLHQMQQPCTDRRMLLLVVVPTDLSQWQAVTVCPQAVGRGEAHEEARIRQELKHAILELSPQIGIEPVVLHRPQEKHPFESWSSRVAQVLRELGGVVRAHDLRQGLLEQTTDH